MRTLYVQQNPDGSIAPESASFWEAVKEDAWEAGEKRYQVILKGLQDDLRAEEGDPELTIPIGSLDFVQKYLRENDLNPLQAVNIPIELESFRYLSRRAWYCNSKEDLVGLIGEEHEPLFVKPGSIPKLFEATTTRYLDDVPADASLFVSEILPDIQAEWRVFVLRGSIKYLAPYNLKAWLCPDRSLVEEMARKVSLPSCTIDVAVLGSGETVLIEVHPFISCGLYGFEGTDLLRMAATAWNYQCFHS